MPHVVTQSCVGDGSCVYSCPVNCIQPTPDDPAFERAEMLHIDPVTCVDCGACVSACPVEAIKPHAFLDPAERLFEAINADYHRGAARPRTALAPVPPPLMVRDHGRPLRVAVVGSGPAGMYAAEELLTIPHARVSVYERLPTPYGLVRAGVAPDHRRTRRVSRQLDRIRAHPGLRMHLGVAIGRDVTHDELLDGHDAVIYAVGAATDRRLEIPGADRPGVLSAGELVGWYNDHPAHRDRAVDLSHRRAVVIGNGNVALDVARILTADPDALADSDIARPALGALRASRIEEVVVVARRGAQDSAFTLPEIVGLSTTPGVSLRVRREDVAGPPTEDPKLGMLRRLADGDAGRGRRVTLRYGLTPTRILPDAVEFGAADERIPAGLVVTAIGYRGLPFPGLPFDPQSGVVPNQDGRVVDPATGAAVPGTYAVGWIKRGPTGSIGTNRRCSLETIATLVADHNAGRLPATA
jgi:ferredoxin/flavodoxin---NADP+ reductase